MAERFRLNCPEIELMGHICLDLFFRIILRIVPRKLTIFHYDEKVSFHPISANPNLKNKSGGHHRFLASPESHDGWKMIFFPFGTAYFQGLCYVNFMGVLQKIHDTVPPGLHGSFTKTKLLPAIEKSSFDR